MCRLDKYYCCYCSFSCSYFIVIFLTVFFYSLSCHARTDDFHFSDGDVGTINRIGIKRRISGAGFDDDKWTLSTVSMFS